MCRIPYKLVLFLLGQSLLAQPVEVVPVRSGASGRTIVLPGEILPYQRVAIHARVNGYIESITVDRGSPVHTGQILASLTAPELSAETAQLESRVKTAES